MHYKKWSQLKKNAGVQITDNPVKAGVHCPMHTALSVLRSVGGVSSLVVGMPECCGYSRFVVDNIDEKQRHYTYVLDDSEVVFGSREGVESALRLMAGEGCKRLLLMRTCVPSLIGEDLEHVAEAMASELGIEIQMLDVAHYKRNGWMAGLSMVLSALGNFAPMIEKRKLVVQLGEAQGAQWQMICQLLQKAGYEIRTILPFDAEGWEEMGASCCNLVCSSLMEPLAEQLRRRFGTESVSLYAAVDEKTTQDCYESMKQILDVELPQPRCQAERPLPDEAVSTIATADVESFARILSNFGIRLKELHMEEAVPWPGAQVGDPEVFFCPDSARHGETSLRLSGCEVDGKEIERAMKYIGCERADAMAILIRNAQRGIENAAL